MRQVRIQLEEMEELLKPEKGWRRNTSGNEYVFDWHMKGYPIVVKVLSTVSVFRDRPKNYGSESIRVFAVMKAGLDEKAKILGGLVKAIRLRREPTWRDMTKCAVITVMELARRNYERDRVRKRA